ncbi:CGNR zinc finger domain-containing protein [Streptomyces durbertensis]|uniref:CGNR zinc finger domain-containing protein n=1 Tax=Streptomyces durbertensis TaxID=2448886 RepID=A0ABR6EKW5_9ACTN|nr:CGNR zinc finger domain-containing protein [Streptomyces durbertensis]MBB1245976.1 CGNR zinc finger domain-containing protein [Streptomyces durbertensis]
MSAAADDPRPLVGEPLSIDLLNTRWIDNHGPQDLLQDLPGLAVWLRSVDLDQRCDADAATLRHLLHAREALAAAVADPATPSEQARTRLNEVLAHGRLHRALTADGPVATAETDNPAHLAAWLAADDYLRLLDEDPTRIRACANPACVLHFFDTSQNRRRRWCSMAACGNRAKAARHYARARN